MKTSRIEVPLTLEAPRFEDESTVATARRVKPIGRAKVTFRLRRVTGMLPFFVAATICGALGAAAVNYYEGRRPTRSATAPEAPASATIQPAPLAVSAASELGGGKIAESQTEAALKDSEAQPEVKEEPRKTETESLFARRSDEPSEPEAAKIPKNNNGDPAKLTRQRRVQTKEPAPVNKNGAGRIADLFSGPNP